MKVKVYYESRTTMIVEDTPKYTVASILSSVGGAIGLFLGLSIVSIFEFLELIGMCVYKGMRKMVYTKSVSTSSSSQVSVRPAMY